ncbi:MAG: hypothetical protein MZV64_44745 [Ignavibacteriales bacterium]|nr:hypothetical protein [Ignavibacteriales bacterium]
MTDGDQARALRVRRHAGRPAEREGGADQVLRGGDRLHPVRPRDGVPLHLGARRAAARPASCCSPSASSCSCWC